MKLIIRLICLSLLFTKMASAQFTKKALGLDSDPSVVYMNQHYAQPVQLQVIDNFPIFSDKNAKNKVGILLGNQIVNLEAMTEFGYKVRGKGATQGVAGWVSPKAFASKDPNFVENLKASYARLVEVQRLIANHEIAIGMTPEEVVRSLGEPTERRIKRGRKGISGTLSWVEYKEVKHFQTFADPLSGQRIRRYTHTTREEKSRVDVDFEKGVVSSIEESDRQLPTGPKIIVRPIDLIF